MLNLFSRIELDYTADKLDESKDRLNVLRRQISIYRQNLRQTFDAEFAAIYVREIVRAECELAGLLNGAPMRLQKPRAKAASGDMPSQSARVLGTKFDEVPHASAPDRAPRH